MEIFPKAEEAMDAEDIGSAVPESTAEKVSVFTCCPLCNEGFEVLAYPGPTDVVCSPCGLRFSLDVVPIVEDAGDQQPAAAAEPASELHRWLAGEPIRPRHLSDWQRFRRWCRRRPFLSGALLTAILIAVTAAGFGTAGYYRASVRFKQTDLERRRAELGRQWAISVAQENARLAAARQQQAEDEMTARSAAERRLQQSEARRLEAEQQRIRAEQQRVVSSHDASLTLARQLADESRRFLGSHPQRSVFLAGESLRVQLQEGQTPNRTTVQILRDALALVGQQGLIGHQGSVLATAISPDGRWLVTGSADRTARLWDLASEDPAASSVVLRRHRGRVGAVAVSPDSRWLVTAGDDSIAILWDLTAGDPSTTAIVLEGHRGPVHAVAFSFDGRWLVTGGGEFGSRDNAARLWNLTNQNPAAEPTVLRGHEKPILTVAFSPDGRWVATAGEDATIRLWNLAARYPAAEQIVLRGHQGRIGSLAISPDSRCLVSACCDGTVRLWSLAPAIPSVGHEAAPPNGRSLEPMVLRGHQGHVIIARISPDGRWLATGGCDKAVRLWDLAANDPSARPVLLEGHVGCVKAATFSSDSRWLITGSFDKIVRLWDLTAEDPSTASTVLRGHTGPINALAVSPDGRWLATGAGDTFGDGGNDNIVRLWDLRLDTLLETAQLAAARRLTLVQREQLLLEAAKRRQPPR